MKIVGMNSIQVSSLSQALAAESGEKVSTGVDAGAAVQFAESAGEKASAVTQVDLEPPIPPETDASRSEQLKSVGDKLETSTFQLGGRSILFDLYAVMALIQLAQQKLRNTQRDLRKCENMAVQDSIIKQAEAQKNAATKQFYIGLGLSLGAVAVSVIGMHLAGRSQRGRQSETENAAGRDVFADQLDMLKGADDKDVAAKNLFNVKRDILTQGKEKGQALIEEVDKAFDFSSEDPKKSPLVKRGMIEELKNNDKIDPSNSDIRDTIDIKDIDNKGLDNKGLDNNKKDVVEKKDVVSSDQIEGKNKVPDSKDSKTEVVEKKDDLPKEPVDKAKDVKESNQIKVKEEGLDPNASKTETEVLKKEDGLSKESVKEEKKQEDTSDDKGPSSKSDGKGNVPKTEKQKENEKWLAKLDECVAKYEKEYNALLEKAVGDASSADSGAKTFHALSDQIKGDLRTAGNKLRYARAKQLDATAGLNVDRSALSNDLSHRLTAAKEFGYAREGRNVGKEFMIVGTVTLLGNAMMSSAMQFSQAWGDIARIDATKAQALQKQNEEALDQMRDLFSNSQNVIQAVIQLFQQVTEKESQSVESIIQGIKA